ncbi:septum formation inhibitor Maf [Maribacter algicola]|uniref:Septum formation inhibitor Maf n=1 Tax=Maribacter algicola TaxID=2498892 RepID=A0A3R8Q2U8_9FLAO|nr:septum formation inhibitor Maf [Maribacter algicola]RRQ48572.1 septum formation inhibitor Maf [Maribacter algicola]
MFKKWLTLEVSVILFAAACTVFQSCNSKESTNKNEDIASIKKEPEIPRKNLPQEFKEYWYSGTAEITSYELEQARYGEIRMGKAVMIYVTEPFLKEKQVKADNASADNIPVLKLNATKKYLTGIYPYSIMTSSFYPVYDNQHALKVSFSAQEWCGHVYAQINNKEDFQVTSHSYFESEADQDFSLKKTILENELWNKLKISPEDLPQGTVQIIPSLEFVRLSHKELKAYDAEATLTNAGDTYTYEIKYPELERTLSITFSNTFPYSIESWSEITKSGFGPNAQLLTSKAKKIKTINTPYWQQNDNKDLYLRDSLGL